MSKKPKGHKLVLLGDRGVGKSCLNARFIANMFDDDMTPSNGASFSCKEIEYPNLGKVLVLDLWDISGSEKMKPLSKYIYNDAAMAILVYDITKKESFYNLKHYWYKELQEYGKKDIVLGIAGNSRK